MKEQSERKGVQYERSAIMRMRQFLIALAAAVLLAGLAVPAAGKKPPPPTPFGEIGVPEFELTDIGPPPLEDWGVRAKVVVTSNVTAVLEHSLTAGEFVPEVKAEDEVRLRKTGPGGTEVRLVVGPPPYECPATYSVTYNAVLTTEDGDFLDSLGPDGVVSEETFTCHYDGPFPGLDYGTETSGKYWTATVVAAAWAFYPDVENFSMTGEFTPPGLVVVDEPDRCEPLSDSRSPWLCTWTRRFDKKAVESVTFEVTDPDAPCDAVDTPIEINRGDGNGFGCWPNP